jgi:hypothetical protein
MNQRIKSSSELHVQFSQLAKLRDLLVKRRRSAEAHGDQGGAERLRARIERVEHLLADLDRRRESR